MTKEEFEKEAEAYADDILKGCTCNIGHPRVRQINSIDVQDAYLAGAEPREKQIEIDAEQIRALQKQNGELTDELTLTNNECKDMREELKQRIRENQKLCEQIEKMKCCPNCDFIFRDGNCYYDKECKNKDHWKLRR